VELSVGKIAVSMDLLSCGWTLFFSAVNHFTVTFFPAVSTAFNLVEQLLIHKNTFIAETCLFLFQRFAFFYFFASFSADFAALHS
jgi:hypothetical protein